MNTANRWKKFFLILAVCIVLAALAVFFVLRHLAGKTNYTDDRDVQLQTETETQAQLHARDVYDLTQVVKPSQEEREGTYTLLVIGGDTPEAEKEGVRRDAQAVILMVINHNLGKCYFASMRTDLYVHIPQGEIAVEEGSLGHVYALGGGPLLLQTIEENYGIPVDNYASISLTDVARIIEIPEFETLDVSENGLEVVKELVYDLGGESPTKVASYITRLLPYVTHNITSDQMMKIVLQIPAIVGYYSLEDNIPYEETFVNLDGYTVPDIGYTTQRMHEMIYLEDYTR